jgi:uncharacterized protein YfaS (alpha-2-macroglobulin family)
MVRPLQSGRATDPVRAIGTAWIGIDPAPHKLGIRIAAPALTLPRGTLAPTITLSGLPTSDHAFVTLSAVDEGILQLTRFTTPDPLAYLYGKQAFGLDIRDDYGRLLADQSAAGRLRQGGDGGIQAAPELPVTSTKIVSLYAGPVDVGADGTAHVTLDVPDFEGQIRLMAVAWSAHAVGSAESDVIVRDPVIVDVALPRFLAPGDAADLALSVADTDGAPGTYHLALGATGPVTVKSGGAQDFTLVKDQRQQGSARVTATGAGIATVTADLTGPGNYHLHREWQIAVRGAHPPISLQTVALLKAGGSMTVDKALLASFVPGSATTSIGLSGSIGTNVSGLLGSLWTYPYGCTEQIASTGFPLLYYGLSSTSLPPNADSPADVHARVQTAIDTLLDRQAEDGTLGLWKLGDGESPPWLEVYATDFLAHAKQAGFDVPDLALARSYRRVAKIADAFDEARGTQVFGQLYGASANETLAYAEYVLAGAGRADIGIIRRLYDQISAPELASADPSQLATWPSGDKSEAADPMALGQLAGALALMGDTDRAKLAMSFAVRNLNVKEVPDWWYDDLFYSNDRDMAGLIAIAAEVKNDGTVAALAPQMKRLGDSDPDSLTTQEKAWLLQADFALNTGHQGDFTANGAKFQNLAMPATFKVGADAAAKGYTLSNDGNRDIWQTVTMTGTPVKAPPAASAGYTLEVDYFTIDGKPLDPSRLVQNDRFIVQIKGNVGDDGRHRTVINAPLPAGWEIETVVRDQKDYPFLGALTQKPSAVEARDDRFIAAVDLGGDWPWLTSDDDDSGSDDDDRSKAPPKLTPDAFSLAYIVRAVTPGRFTLPETVVQDMYRPALMARTASGTTTAAAR